MKPQLVKEIPQEFIDKQRDRGRTFDVYGNYELEDKSLTYLKIHTSLVKAINRVLRSTMTRSDMDLLLFIIDRTIGYSKCKEVIPIRHFEDGIESSGLIIQCPLGMDKKTRNNSMKYLMELGYVSINKVSFEYGEKNEFEINFNKMLKDAEKIMQESKLKVSRKYRQKSGQNGEGEKSPIGGVKSHRGGRGKSHLHNIKNTKHSEVEHNEESSSAASELEKNISKTRIRSTERRKKKAMKVNIHPTVTSFKDAWKDALVTHYEECMEVPITKKAAGQLKHILNTFDPNIQYTDLIDWVVGSWTRLARGELDWLRTIPKYPDLNFFAQHFKNFIKAYNDSSVDEMSHYYNGKDSSMDLVEAREEISNLKNQLAESQGKYHRLERDTSIIKQALENRERKEKQQSKMRRAKFTSEGKLDLSDTPPLPLAR